jgi:S-adenosylmethionine hydrolase
MNQNPDARLIDASHGVPAFDIPTGAFMLLMAAREFPGDVVFVAVVAPYTRTEPRYLVLTTEKDQIFVLPDNGRGTYVTNEMGIKSLYSVDNAELFSKPIVELSAEHLEGTVGARIATGYKPSDIGAKVTDQVMLDVQEPVVSNGQLLGTVIFVDNFGNCVTNIAASDAVQYGLAAGDSVRIVDSSDSIAARYGTIYSDVPEGKEIVFVNGNLGVVQLSINMGNYAETYNLKAGSQIGIQKTGSTS